MSVINQDPGKGQVPRRSLEEAGARALSTLSAPAQSWAQSQALQLVSTGQFGPIQQRHLTLQASSIFPHADQTQLLAVVRFLALKHSLGNNFTRLYGNRSGLTAFHSQLMAGLVQEA